MTLTLDDVRNKRFRMARKSGYEVLEVDEFVDEVEESFAQLVEENQNLRKQVEALKAAPPPAPAPHTVAPAPTVQPPAPRQPAPVQAPMSGTIVVTTGKEASAAVVRLVEMSTEQAERLVEELEPEPSESSRRLGSTPSGSRLMRSAAPRSSIGRLKVAAGRCSGTWRSNGTTSRQPCRRFATSKRLIARTSPPICAGRSRHWSPAEPSRSMCRRWLV
jgi:DivIVA domain-containing protein